MRAYEFLKEYSIGDAKAQVAGWIENLDVNDKEHVALLDKIYKVLNKDHFHGTISQACAAPLSDEDFSDKVRAQIVDDMARLIFSLDADVKATNDFVDQLAAGGVVNINELMKPATTFKNIFTHPLGVDCFNALSAYGVGKQQKGPGEYAFAMLSDQIKLSSRGDLEINGKLVELKAQQSTAGGRIGHTGRGGADILAILEKHAESIPRMVSQISAAPDKYLSLQNFVKFLNIELPTSDAENVAKRKEIVKDLYQPLFGDTSKLEAAIASESYKDFEDAYIETNWAWYTQKEEEPFDILLAISFKSNKSIAIKSAKDLIALREAGHLNAFSISAYPSKSGGGREGFAQLSISSRKV